jgi:hypothetical protein
MRALQDWKTGREQHVIFCGDQRSKAHFTLDSEVPKSLSEEG